MTLQLDRSTTPMLSGPQASADESGEPTGRITEGGDTRITEAGDTRILET